MYCNFSEASNNISMSCEIPILSAMYLRCFLVLPAKAHKAQELCSFISIDHTYVHLED